MLLLDNERRERIELEELCRLNLGAPRHRDAGQCPVLHPYIDAAGSRRCANAQDLLELDGERRFLSDLALHGILKALIRSEHAARKTPGSEGPVRMTEQQDPATLVCDHSQHANEESGFAQLQQGHFDRCR